MSLPKYENVEFLAYSILTEPNLQPGAQTSGVLARYCHGPDATELQSP